MTDCNEQVELELDSLTRATRLVAGIAPKTAVRVSLGVVLAVEDTAKDPAGRLLGAKINRGAADVASRCGAFFHDRVSSKAKRRVSQSVPTAGVQYVDKARGIVLQAASKTRNTWRSAGYATVEVVDADTPAVRSAVPDEAGSEVVDSMPVVGSPES